MEDDEMEVTREELHMLIQNSVNSRQLMSENVRIKCKQLQSLLERKEKMSTDLLKLFESVSKCETTVRMLYSKLGWEYNDLDSEGNNCNSDNSVHSGVAFEETDILCRASPVSSDFAAANSSEEQPETRSKTPEERPKASEEKSKTRKEKSKTRKERSKTPKERSKTPEVKLKPSHLKELRVILTRLPKEQKRDPPPSTSKRMISDDELSNVDGDPEYHPSGCSSDSDVPVSSAKSDKQKKKKLRKVEFKVNVKDRPVPQSTSTVRNESSQTVIDKSSSNGANATETVPNVKPDVKMETKASSVSREKKDCDSVLPLVLQELKVGMQVLAKRKKLTWESGKIAEIVEKEDGTKKFKVTFEDKGKVLVSGHHIAYDAMPKLAHLSVGGRVVSKSSLKNNHFTPGILGELPSRKNHMRFLVFFDDQKASYVALPVLRLVSKPLPNPLDDIRDEKQKDFIKEYLERMPYPPHTQFRVGQKIKVDRNDTMETCTVLLLDCSLMEVVYARDEEKEWIYRGSIRLEHVFSMKEQSKK